MKGLSKMQWEDPRILEMDALPEAFGDCKSGDTAATPGSPTAGCISGTTVTQGDNVCATGQQTSSNGIGHPCLSGGFAGPAENPLNCTTGSSVGIPA